MKLNVSFSGNTQAMPTTMTGQSRAFSVGFSGTTYIHNGQNGATFYPAVSDDGLLTWTNDRDLPNPEPVNIKGADGEPGVAFETDATLTLENGVLSVNTAEVVEEDNTLPVTSAAVYTTVGNINALLATI